MKNKYGNLRRVLVHCKCSSYLLSNKPSQSIVIKLFDIISLLLEIG